MQTVHFPSRYRADDWRIKARDTTSHADGRKRRLANVFLSGIVLVLAASSASAQETTCGTGGDWNGRISVDAHFSSGDRQFGLLTVVCHKGAYARNSAIAWGIMRYLRDDGGTEHRYAHPGCAKVFPTQRIAVVAGKVVGAEGEANNGDAGLAASHQHPFSPTPSTAAAMARVGIEWINNFPGPCTLTAAKNESVPS